MPIQWYNGGILWANGGIAFHADCCCGGCISKCGCCFSADTNITTGDWPVLELDESYGWIHHPAFFHDQYWPRFISIINAARPGTQTFPMFGTGGVPYDKSVTATADSFVDTTWYGTPGTPVTWTMTPTISYRVVFRIWSLDTVCSWGIEVTALIHIYATDGTNVYEDTTVEYSIDGYWPTPEAVQCCGVDGGSATWGGSVNAGNPVITGTGGQGDIVVSNNKCCRSSEIGGGGTWECTNSGTENCTSNADDALCIPEEPI